MPQDESHPPLLSLIDNANAFVESMENDREFKYATEHRLEVDELRANAKQIIVWLELKDQDEAAARLDEVSGAFRSAFAELKEIYDLLHQPEAPRCREALVKVIDAGGHVSGSAEDLLDELPDGIWEGFDA